MPQFPAGLPPPSTALAGRRVAQRPSQSRVLRTPTNTQLANPVSPPLHVCTYNVRTLKSVEDLEHLTRSLDNIKHDIICLQETRRQVREDTSTREHTLHIGPARRGIGGVGFLIKKHLSPWISEIKFLSHRIGQLLMRDPNNPRLTISIISCYSPTELDPLGEIDLFYDTLNETIRSTRTFISMVCGDFNGRISPRIDPTDNRIGPYSLHTQTSDNGNLLVELLYRNKLYHCNSFFEKKLARRWTWRSPNNATHAELDHVLCNRINLVTDTTVLPAVDAGSDHRLIRTTLTLKNSSLKRATRSTRRTKKHGSMNPKQFQQALSSNPILLDAQATVEEQYQRTCEWILQAEQEATNLCPSSERVSDRTMWHLKNRRSLLNDPTTSPVEVAIAAMTCRRLLKEDLALYKEKKLLEAATQRRSIKKAAKSINSESPIMEGLKDKSGKMAHNRRKIEKIVRDYYSNLFRGTSNRLVNTNAQPTSIPSITRREIEAAAKQLKQESCPGEDKISNRMLKHGGEVLWSHLAELFSVYLVTSQFPEAWKSSRTKLIPKKGDQHNLDNYRPISVLSCLYKLFSRVILNRIRSTLEDEQPPTQAGFRKGFSTLDHIHAVDQVLEKTREFQIPLVAVFVDFRKAFDTVETWAILDALKQQGIQDHYIHIIKQLSTDLSTNINLFGNDISIPISRGIRQGDVTSPILFASALEMAFRNLDWDTTGININGTYLSHLRYADDIVLFGHGTRTAERMLEQLQRECSKIGLSLNESKTKWIKNKWSNGQEIKLDGRTIERVESFVYLGRSLTSTGELTEEINRRRRAAWASFGNIRDVTMHIPDKLRAHLFNSHVNPALLYAAETWASTQEERRKVEVTQKSLERALLGTNLREQRRLGLRSTDLRRQSGIEGCSDILQRAKHRWAGHVCRQKNDRWTKTLTFWKPWGHKRPPGRPKMRYCDTFDKDFKAAVKANRRSRRTYFHWSQIATDRDKWKAGIFATCSSC